MKELRDSADVADVGAELRARLRQDGYVFLRGQVPADAVQRVRGAVVAVLREEDWLAPDAGDALLLPGPQACREAGDTYWTAYRRVVSLQVLNELAHDPALVGLARMVLDRDDVDVLVHPRKIARASMPHDTEYTRPHQDFPLVQGAVDTFTTWLPLGDCPVALGGLRVLEGSHLDGLLPARPDKGPGAMSIGVDDDDPRWRSSDYRAGDVILFHSLTVHGALPNETDGLRLSVDFRYQAADEPVGRGSLEPHYLGALPDWDEITAGWTSRDSIATPASTTAVELDDPWSDLVAPPSRLLTSLNS